MPDMRHRGAARSIGLLLVAVVVGALVYYWSARELRTAPKPNRPMTCRRRKACSRDACVAYVCFLPDGRRITLAYLKDVAVAAIKVVRGVGVSPTHKIIQQNSCVGETPTPRTTLRFAFDEDVLDTPASRLQTAITIA
jgi:hypothetical protein